MPLDTNFNVSPYFDDFDEQRNFHRVLFKPGVSVQARELTQLQTILQNQVERFGENIFKTGTIVSGCSISTDGSLDYVKIRDSQVDGQPAALSLYNNSRLINETSNLEAVLVNIHSQISIIWNVILQLNNENLDVPRKFRDPDIR